MSALSALSAPCMILPMNETFAPMPVTLTGTVVRLEPLALEHLEALVQAGADPRIWEWAVTDAATPEATERYIRVALAEQAEGRSLPFAVRHLEQDRIIGSTRFANIARADRGLEIGWTWYHPDFWRTAVNTECKLLLLAHAFETLGAIRVEFKTDVRNTRSRAAILRLGAREEGIFRSKAILHDGHRRDTIYFSILDHEWPEVRQRLEKALRRES